jgi:hypothetical protein
MSRRGAAWAVAAPPVLAGDGVAAAAARGRTPAEPSPAAQRLAAALGRGRPLDGRLCIGGADPSPLHLDLAQALAFAGAAREIALAAGKDPSPRSAHDLALLRVLEGRLDDAAGLLAEVAAGGGAPPCAWSDLAAVTIAIAGQDDAPHRLLAALDASLRAANDPAGRLNRALAKSRLGLPSAAEEWERALRGEDDAAWQGDMRQRCAALERVPVTDHAASVRRAGVLQALGRPREAWDARLRALAALRDAGPSRERSTLLAAAVEVLLDEGSPACACAFAEDLAREVVAHDDAALLAGAHQLQARASVALGRPAGARRALADARAAAAEAGEPALRRRLQAEVDRTQAEMELRNGRPGEALRLLSRALRASAAPGLAGLRARALLAAGRPREARTVLEAAAPRGPAEAREVALLGAITSGSARRALAHAESALDPGFAGGAAGLEAVLRALEARLPADAAVVEYALAEGVATAWVLSARGTTQVRLAAPASEIQAAVANRALPWLYRALWEPLLSRLPAAGRLALVPHDVLHHVPWTGLLSGAPRWSLSLAPSAMCVSRALDRTAPPPAAAGPVLLIGAPAFDRTSFPWLPPAAPGRAALARLAARHPGAHTLLGGAATRDAVLRALPEAAVVHYAGAILTDDTGAALLLTPANGQAGTLYGHEIAALDLTAVGRVVLSSAASVAEPDVRRDDAGSLARAFLEAGVGAVVTHPDAPAWSQALPAPPAPAA